jgi:hypothetical protein
MPWGRKPAPHLEYWTGPVNRNAGFKTIIVHCLGPEKPASMSGASTMAGLTLLICRRGIGAISARTCAARPAGRDVDTRVDWSEVVNFNKGVG